MTEQEQTRLQQLIQLWKQEHDATAARFVEERKNLPLRERIQRGLALERLSLLDVEPAPGGRLLLWIQPEKSGALESLRLGSGAPVRLWWDEPDSEDALPATVARVRRDRIGVMITGDLPSRLEEGLFCLDREEPQATFERGQKALTRLLQAEPRTPQARLRSLLFGEADPEFEPQKTLSPLDSRLNDSQQEAVAFALSAHSLALIHGPPGTGKTRTLVEVIRQALKQGRTILATAASNAAVDNLAERLLDADVPLLRLGHPARVSERIEAHTLDARLEKTEAWVLSRRWTQEARELQRTLRKRSERGQLNWSEKKAMRQEITRLFRDARRQLQGTQKSIVQQARLICATAAGADVAVLGDRRFDLVVLDEATQATDPIALVALSRGECAVMAGDPCQLPPTVISQEAESEGLGTTFFERMAAEGGAAWLRLLKVQYRMHSGLMSFPSESMYNGLLEAAEGNKEHLLEHLEGVEADPLRAEPLCFVDTSGKGWEEVREEEDPSTSNPEEATRVAAEVRRLLSRGLPAQEIAVISPYYAQVRLLRSLLEEEVRGGLEVDTVDGFQGREKEAVVVALVRCNEQAEIGFLKDIRRMNVAITRARRFLLVVGDSATVGSHPYYAGFLEAAEEQGGWQSVWEDDAPLFERWE